MAVPSVAGFVTGMLPSAQTIYEIFIYIGAGLLLAGLVGAVVWWAIDKKKWDKMIKLHKKINGQIVFVANFPACFEKLGLAGDVWCQVKGKKIISRPKIEYGRNVYLYYEREDGEWINFGIEDVDDKMKKAGVFYLDEDMRLHRIGIQKNLERRLQKVTFWDKYGNIIIMALFVIIITVCLIVLFNKITELADALGRMAVAIEKIANALMNIGTQQTSGVVPVNMSSGGVPL